MGVETDAVKLLLTFPQGTVVTRQCSYEKKIFQEKIRKRYFLLTWGYVLLGNILHRLKVLSYGPKTFRRFKVSSS